MGDAAAFFDPDHYAQHPGRAFSTKARLVALIQVFVQTPGLMDVAVQRLQGRPEVAQDLGRVLGDPAPARLDLAWRLLGP